MVSEGVVQFKDKRCENTLVGRGTKNVGLHSRSALNNPGVKDRAHNVTDHTHIRLIDNWFLTPSQT